MSCTEIYSVAPNGDVVPFAEVHKWGGAMAVWMRLAECYLPTPDVFTLMLQEMRPVIDLLDTDRLAGWERLTLLTTLDRAIVPVPIVEAVADALDQFQEHHTVPGRLLLVSKQAVELRRLLAEVPEHGWRGACWNQTSVSSSLWHGYNVDSMDRHWYIEDPRER